MTVRALLFAVTTNPLLLIGIQLLDGISGSVLGVLTALIVDDLTKGHRPIRPGAGLRWDTRRHRRVAQHHTLQPRRRNFWWRDWICRHCGGSTEHGLDRLAVDAGNESVEQRLQAVIGMDQFRIWRADIGYRSRFFLKVAHCRAVEMSIPSAEGRSPMRY